MIIPGPRSKRADMAVVTKGSQWEGVLSVDTLLTDWRKGGSQGEKGKKPMLVHSSFDTCPEPERGLI